MRFAARLVLVLVVLGGSAGALAAQDGLYAPVRPEDTALVRVIHVNWASGAAPVTVDAGNTRFAAVAAGSATPYRPVRPGVYVIMAYGRREALTAANGTFHTVLISPNRITILRDTWHEDPLRAQLVLYNATTAPLRLDAVVPEATLMAEVTPGSSGTRVVNAITVTLAASRIGHAPEASGGGAGPRAVWETSLDLARGASYGLVVGETEDGLVGFTVAAEVAAGAAE